MPLVIGVDYHPVTCFHRALVHFLHESLLPRSLGQAAQKVTSLSAVCYKWQMVEGSLPRVRWR